MNSFYKLKSSLLLVTSVCFISCDSSTDFANGVVSPTDVTNSDVTVSAGELFTFEDLLAPDEDQFLDTLRVTSENIAAVGDVNYNYVSTGATTATLTGVAPIEIALDDAVMQLFSITNADNSEVRSLLAVTDSSGDPNLTDAQLDRLVELLNSNGAGISRNPNNDSQLVALPVRVYTMTFTSSLEERAAGLASGTYALQSRSQLIAYNITPFTDGEGNTFQFFLPTVTNEDLGVGTFEQGTFTLELNNEIGF